MSCDKIDNIYVGEYDVIYYSELLNRQKKVIKSKLVIDNRGQAVLYNNIGDDIQEVTSNEKDEVLIDKIAELERYVETFEN